jgi:acetoin utilization protein AcuB
MSSEALAATVREVMTPSPVTAEPGTSADDAVRLMKEIGCRHLPVLDGGRLVGVVSSKDVGCECSKQRTVGDVMSREVLTAAPGDTIELAAAKMAVAKVDCLPVVEGGQLVGILTTYDVLDLVCRRFRAKASG